MAKVSKKFVDLYENEFRKEVLDRVKQIDESEEQDWYSLTLGWAIAKGLTPGKAHDWSRYARYERHYE